MLPSLRTGKRWRWDFNCVAAPTSVARLHFGEGVIDLFLFDLGPGLCDVLINRDGVLSTIQLSADLADSDASPMNLPTPALRCCFTHNANESIKSC